MIYVSPLSCFVHAITFEWYQPIEVEFAIGSKHRAINESWVYIAPSTSDRLQAEYIRKICTSIEGGRKIESIDGAIKTSC